MKKSLKLLSILSLSLLGLYSCKDEAENSLNFNSKTQNEEILIPSTAKIFNSSSLRENTNQSYLDAEEFAKLLASSLNDKEVRKFLKNEANKKTDGDFDILVSQVLNAKIGIQSFSEKIKNNSTNGLIKGNEIFNNAIKNPKLNISIPILIEKWDDTKQQPLVAVTVGTSEKKVKFLKAFDSKGKAYLIDANIEPNVPVIVIGNNERMNYQNDIKKAKNIRTSGNYEKVTWLQCPNLNQIEGWFNGSPELRFEGVVYNDNFSGPVQAFKNMEYPPHRHNASNGYTLASWTQIQNLFIWHFDNNHGPDYYIQVFEIDDDGTTETLSVNVTSGTKKDNNTQAGGATFGMSYTAEDKILKGELIHYTHPTPSTIGDGSIQFILEN